MKVPAPDATSVCFTRAAAEAEAREADRNKGQRGRFRNREADALLIEQEGIGDAVSLYDEGDLIFTRARSAQN